MKKVYVLSTICITIVILFICCVFFVKSKLPEIFSYVLSSVMRADVNVSHAKIEYRGGIIKCYLTRLKIGGWLDGDIENWEIESRASLRPTIKNIKISHFDLKVNRIQKGAYRIIPSESFILKSGVVRYKGRGFFVEQLTLKKRTEQEFFFEGVVKDKEVFGSVFFSGEAIYEKEFYAKGQILAEGLVVEKVLGDINGKCGISGNFILEKDNFFLNGEIKTHNVTLNFGFLKKPLSYGDLKGGIKLSIGNGNVVIRLSSLCLLSNSAFFIEGTWRNDELNSFILSSEFLDFDKLKETVDIDHILKKKISNVLSGGRIKIRSLQMKKNNWDARIVVDGLNLLYKNLSFRNTIGDLFVNRERVEFTDFAALYGESKIFDAKGKFFFEKEKIDFQGRYSAELRDLSYMFDTKDLKFKNGHARGYIEIKGGEGKGYEVFSNGYIENGVVIWKRLEFDAKASYTVRNEEISFEPLILRRGKQEIILRGNLKKDSFKFFMQGSVKGKDVEAAFTLPFSTDGLLLIEDLEIQKQNDVYEVDGSFGLSDLTVMFRDLIRKESGTKAAVRLKGLWDANRIKIDDLILGFANSNISLKGETKGFNVFDFNMYSKIEDLAEIEGLFLKYGLIKGDLEVELSGRGVIGSSEELPFVKGRIVLKNGYLKLPNLVNPLDEFHLSSILNGNSIKVYIEGLRCGKTVIEHGNFSLDYLKKPLLFVRLNMNSFDLEDFVKIKTVRLNLPTVKKGSIVERTEGNFQIHIDLGRVGVFEGRNIDVDGTIGAGQIVLFPLSMEFFEGKGNFKVFFDMAKDIPEVGLEGVIENVNFGDFFRLYGAKSENIKGKGSINANIFLHGRNMEELIRNMNGTIFVHSKDGIINKWHVLSKIFATLNIYELFRRGEGLSSEGLYYRKLSGSFSIKDGVAKTDDFFIESPSMLIKAEGKINFREKKMDGQMTISPFVTLDKTIEKIPLLRDILREKRRGFLYATYKIHGDLDNPEVELSVLKTFVGSFLDTIKRILRLPERIIK